MNPIAKGKEMPKLKIKKENEKTFFLMPPSLVEICNTIAFSMCTRISFITNLEHASE